MPDTLSPEALFAPVAPLIDALASRSPAVFARLTEGLPQQAWWIPFLALLVLGGTSLYDARKGRVPDLPVFLGLLATIGALGFFTSWSFAGGRLALGFGAAIVLWGVNQLYYNWQKQDAIGMGDAKWTALAVAAFGIKPAVFAWVIGAWLGLLWLALDGLARLVFGLFRSSKKRERPLRVHFAPFLFLGLLAGFYWNSLS